MVKVNQIKAARGLLGWHQKDLARLAGISELSVINIENAKTSPQKATLDKIISAFALMGVAFTENGVDIKDNSYTVLRGRNWYAKTLEDVENTISNLAPDKPRDWFLFYCDDRHSPQAVIDKLKSMKEKGIVQKALIEEGNTYIYGDLENYRYIPAGFFNKDRLVSCYGDKVSITEQAYEQSSVYIFRNEELACFLRGIAQLLWDILPQPKKTKSQKLI